MADTFNKRLSSDDVFNIPYEANKQWDIESSSFESSNIHFQLAQRPSESINKNLYPTESLLYNSILANFYPEYYYTASLDTSSYYQTPNYTASLTSQANVITGSLRLGNGQSTYKWFPTYDHSYVYALNIPKSLYSEKILPTTWEMEISGGKIYDDGEYNLYYTGALQTSSIGTTIGNNSYVGNVFYEQGLAVLTVSPLSIIPPPYPGPPAPTGSNLPEKYEWVALWYYDPTQGTKGDFSVDWEYTLDGTPSRYVNVLSQDAGVFGVWTSVIRQDVGSGKFTNPSGISITNPPFYSRILSISGKLLGTPNVIWDVFSGQELAALASVIPDTPYQYIPFDAQVAGYLVYGNSLWKGVNFNQEA